MLGFVTEDKECLTEACKNGIQVVLGTVEKVRRKVEVTPVWINSKDNRRLVKSLRIVENDAIVYLALGRAVVYQEEHNLKDVATWLKKRIILPSEGYSNYENYEKMQDKHDLVVSFRG